MNCRNCKWLLSVVSYLEREIEERFLLIIYFDRFMSREALRNFYDAKTLEILMQAGELLSYPYPYQRKENKSFPYLSAVKS